MTSSSRDFLFGRINYERRTPRSGSDGAFDLRTMRTFMERIGNPESAFPVVHVAGTKGKGSTSTMIAEILAGQGLRTGLYTSPHLHCLEERFRIGSDTITSERLDQLIREIRPIVDRLDQDLAKQGLPGPTFFEITTALAFRYFRQESVDVGVIEVGLGGRLDSTNVCTPVVSVITNIGMDHMHLLGDRVDLIAREKAGIIKPNVPTVSGETTPAAAEVIAEVAAERHCPLYVRDRDFGLAESDRQWDCWTAIPNGTASRRVHADLQVGMAGLHQRWNAATAVATCEVLRSAGWSISNSAIRKGLASTRVPGRIEILDNPPRTILDIAHNVPSLQALVHTLEQLTPNAERTLVMAISREKDLAGMLACLPDHFDRVIFTQFLNNPRAVEASQLLDLLQQQLRQRPAARLKLEAVSIATNPAESMERVSRRGPNEWLIVAGSAFLAAECRQAFENLAIKAPAGASDLVGLQRENSL